MCKNILEQDVDLEMSIKLQGKKLKNWPLSGTYNSKG
jgi:hypothetical protein